MIAHSVRERERLIFEYSFGKSLDDWHCSVKVKKCLKICLSLQTQEKIFERLDV